MKKLIALILAAMFVFAVASCGNEPAQSTPTESTPAESTPEVTTPEESTPEVTEPEESTPEATDPEESTKEPEIPVIVELPEAYVDFDFRNGTITDAKGHATIENRGATVVEATVTAGGKSANLNALRIDESGSYVLCTFGEMGTEDAVKEWAEGGFAVEAFYVMGEKKGVQGIVCGTEQVNSTKMRGGWGLAENVGKPYFITATSGNAYISANTTASSSSSETELVHVVAVYDYAAKKQYLYVNGVCVNSAGETISGEFAPAGAEAFNKFCFGSDYRETAKVTETTPIDFPTPDMTMVDAKIYSSALSAEQVKAAYENALALLD